MSTEEKPLVEEEGVEETAAVADQNAKSNISAEPEKPLVEDANGEKAVEDEEPKYVVGEEGCRPCCSFPHGKCAMITSVLASIAWFMTLIALNNCEFLVPQNYLWCREAPPAPAKYGTCGDCHCINGDEPCPSDPKEIPLIEVPNDWLKQLEAMEAKNPYKMTCNPYNTTGGFEGNCTDPPQELYQLELWETAACGLTYDMDTLDENQCPTEYTLKTYDSEEEMKAAGAVMTHWGACGACSTSKDMAVYLRYPDLTGKGQECSVRFLADGFEEGVRCFQEVDYTYECAVMWMYNVVNTRDNCFDVCVDFTFFSDGANNGPPPQCTLANCLLCDEQMSGPIFQTAAARSRRRTGLLSKIVRPCENLLIVDHEPPCNVTRKMLKEQGDTRALQGEQSKTRITPPPKFVEPERGIECQYINTPLGLGGYSGTKSNTAGLFGLFTNTIYESTYDTCFRYDFARVLSGFWAEHKSIFGAAYQAALIFAFLASLLGTIFMIMTWCSTCLAYSARTWRAISIVFGICGVFMVMTMVFFASEVCSDGCKFGKAAKFAILSSVVWFFAAATSWMTPPFNRSIPKSTCCCCPTPIVDGDGTYYSIPTDDDDTFATTNVVVVESEEDDGTRVVEKTTTRPNGKKTVERTLHQKK